MSGGGGGDDEAEGAPGSGDVDRAAWSAHGRVSATAQRVAARRLRFERVPSDHGDPVADDRLAADVAGEAPPPPDERMERFLQARTTFFDRVVADAVERSVPQLVGVGAGYDGRALRYARPEVRWFEVDRAATQADKRRRLDRLAIDGGHVTFVPADIARDDIGDALAAAGHDRTRPSLFCCEGVAVYLDRPVLHGLLERLRSIAAPGSRLAVSLPVATTDEDREVQRGYGAKVAALGEPARTTLTGEEADDLLATTGWHPGPPERRLGPVRLVVLRPGDRAGTRP